MLAPQLRLSPFPSPPPPCSGMVACAGLLWSLLALQGMPLSSVLDHAACEGEGLLACAVRSRRWAAAPFCPALLWPGTEQVQLRIPLRA